MPEDPEALVFTSPSGQPLSNATSRNGLDAQRAAAYPRPGKSEKVIDLTEKKAKAASDQQLRKVGPAGLEPATNGL